MRWLFATVVLLLIVLSPKFRKLGLIIGAAVIAAIVIILIGNSPNKPAPSTAPTGAKSPPATHARLSDPDDYRIEQQDKEDPEAKTRIPLGSVRLVQIEPNFTLPSGSMQSLYARLYNDSQRFTLTDYAYYLTVQDCAPDTSQAATAEQCTTVYDQRARGIPLTVPPNQARDITINIPSDSTTQTPPFKILGKARIELAITDTRAYRSADTPQSVTGAP